MEIDKWKHIMDDLNGLCPRANMEWGEIIFGHVTYIQRLFRATKLQSRGVLFDDEMWFLRENWCVF